MRVIEEQDNKKRNQRIVTILAFCILGLAIIIGLIILLIWLNNRAKDLPNPDDNPNNQEVNDTSSESSYNRLLELVNIEANKYSYTPAEEIISFDYQAEIFHISASNTNKVYNYSIDMSSLSYTSIDQAYDYLMDNNPSNALPKVFDQSNIIDIPSSYTSRYITSDVKHKTVTTSLGDKTYITSTMYNITTEKINIIYNSELNTVIDNSYSPIEIYKTSKLYPLYKYIACK